MSIFNFLEMPNILFRTFNVRFIKAYVRNVLRIWNELFWILPSKSSRIRQKDGSGSSSDQANKVSEPQHESKWNKVIYVRTST